MNLATMLAARAAPVRVGLIGAGKFGAMFLAQARRTVGLHVLAIADLRPDRAHEALTRVGWPVEAHAATSFRNALDQGSTFVTDDAAALVAADGLDVVIDATGDPAAGIRHARLAFKQGRHVVMVNVEADVLAGPLLAVEARSAGVVYSLAYGDQPALICELVDWARTAGFRVVAAGKGTKYLPHFHKVTPDDVWEHYGLSAERAAAAGMNPQMFNSFLDGTKSGIEMCAVANATGLLPPAGGLLFPPAGTNDLAEILRPAAEGGVLDEAGTVEVVSSLARDGSVVPGDLRWGVYVTFEAADDYVRGCFADYGLRTDASGRYAAMYKPWHLIGLELGVSVASVALRGEATGQPTGWRGDVIAVAKRALKAGETLDGEGGYTVWGRLMRAADSVAMGGLPIGLAHGVALKADIAEGQPIRWQDVAVDLASEAVQARRAMEAAFAKSVRAAE